MSDSPEQQSAAAELLRLKLDVLFERGLDLADRRVQLVGIVDEQMFKALDAHLSVLEAESNEPITVVLNSSGGHAYDGHALAARIRSSPCQITVKGYGAVMSAATLILAAGHKRELSKYAIVMIHESSAEFAGKSLEMKHYAKWCVREEVIYCNMMAELTGTQSDVWKKIIGSGRDQYFDAEEILKLGLVDRLF